ncbi:RecQ family ATP-dependent DNA helicase [Alkalibacter mobilis]|uniref:RecQ family ATP-dependent DNA helicase n=1 Tax=Alkalibacter mobilis TaxID=2787712 RepID=UPI00189EAF9F|nr:RecQ family ATP-dependent DNA helicase [Alkalibacter mobilis]MBF7097851.1 RecQ family ATP-dependent DNA helicase [Alkalibacter mobilis]
MKSIAFIDTEVSVESKRINDFGAINDRGEIYHEPNLKKFVSFIQDSDFLCGHNIINHDLKYLRESLGTDLQYSINHKEKIIDTLYLSSLLFPQRPYHALVKDDKLQTEELNNPLNDARNAMNLFYDELEEFKKMPRYLQNIYYGLLKDKKEFCGFFQFLDFESEYQSIDVGIKEKFKGSICEYANIQQFVIDFPVELAYCIALIHANDEYSIMPPWILKTFPEVDPLMHKLRGKPCLQGCAYCNEQLDAVIGLREYFNYDSYRTFEGIPLQETAARSAIENKSQLVIFPTGGGKSIKFQVPALVLGKATKGLTVVISPLQSLMKDQVDNLEEKSITQAVTINGLLDPIERMESIRRVENGDATMLYIAPESLRSKTIERLVLNRKICRFVIDEAHCFSSWGHDFRVDYLYIGEFIKNICNKKNLEEMIPVSCFTATAKQNVIDDIVTYFKKNLNLDLEIFSTKVSRKNLVYKVIEKNDDEKYDEVRMLLERKDCPTIIYVSRTKKADDLALRLTNDGYSAKAFHGKMDKKEKSDNQDAFIHGDVQIMVATSAFGMGVDKSDVGMVIHHDISDSLENYVQEAGRAGRDQNIKADCYILFNDEDLNKHFILLNQTKISKEEIQQVWKAIKSTTRTRNRMSSSALEIAREAGWDDTIMQIETRVTTAIAALENAGYIKRGQNMPKVYANSIMARSVIDAINKIRKSGLFAGKEEEQAIRIIKKLISSRSRKHAQNETPESRVDYISDDLGIEKKQVIYIVQLLREARVLADAKDITAYLEAGGNVSKSFNTLIVNRQLEEFLIQEITEEKSMVNIKILNEAAETNSIKKSSPEKIRKILNFWETKGYIHRDRSRRSPNNMRITFLQDKEDFLKIVESLGQMAYYILEYLSDICEENEDYVEFSVLELKEECQLRLQMLNRKVTTEEVENALIYLNKIGGLKLEGGFLVTYNGLSIERLETDNKIQYKVDDYKQLQQFYEQKTQMIHIVGEYARKVLSDYQSALQFVDDYFQLEDSSFLRKYFKGQRNAEIKKNITPEKFMRLFGELSPAQLKIINDKDSKYIVVAAGPGSGKTRILVHKLASLLLMEDIKHEQLLMITFSRSAATEFKKRLMDLIGNAAHYIEIKTFHSYCFDIMGRVGSIENSSNIIKEATNYIENSDVELSKITKAVLVIDEAQDMDVHEFHLVKTLIEKNDDMRVIAVGDDDQNIYGFRGSDSKYMQSLLEFERSNLYELVENYRSKSNLVEFTNVFVDTVPNRMKSTPIMSAQLGLGSIQVIRYASKNLIEPVINKLMEKGMSGSTCIMTKTNEEAFQIAGLLKKNGIHAKLIQSNEHYNLYDLDEVRYFVDQLNLYDDTYVIQNDIWNKAKKQLNTHFLRSKNLSLCNKIIEDFEEINNKYKYKSDLLIFLRESQEEDFHNESRGSISISTIHKAKGREFEHVILMLVDFRVETEEAKRQLYVGMTRAKESLEIHYNDNYLSKSSNNAYGKIEALQYRKDTRIYAPSDFLSLQLNHRDVYLDYFITKQQLIKNLMSGDEIIIDDQGCLDNNRRRILMFSSKFKGELDKLKAQGYEYENARVSYVINWNKEDSENEIRIVLPEIDFMKGKVQFDNKSQI